MKPRIPVHTFLLTALVLALLAFAANAQPSEVVTASDVYWLTRLDAIRGLVEPFTIIGIVSAGGAVIAVVGGAVEDLPAACRWGRRVLFGLSAPLLVLATGIQGFVPTTREAIAIVVVPKIANNEDIQGLGADTVNVAREWLNELRPASAKDGAK